MSGLLLLVDASQPTLWYAETVYHRHVSGRGGGLLLLLLLYWVTE
jgi:hypothetical protein